MTPFDSGFRTFQLEAPDRGTGAVSLIEFGPARRAVDCVFLHANGFNAFTYRRLLAPLAADWRILALDQRGHGATKLPAEPAGRTDWLDLRDDLLAVLKAMDLRDVVLAGHSLGGTVSLLAASQDPGRARALVLLDPVMIDPSRRETRGASPMVAAALRRRATFPTRADAFAAYRGRGAFATWPDAVIEDYLAAGMVEQPDGGVALACAPAWEASSYAAHDHDSWGALAAYPGPVTILAAETASTFHPPQAQRLEAAPGRVTIERLSGSTHFLPMEQPERVRRTLVEAFGTRA